MANQETAYGLRPIGLVGSGANSVAAVAAGREWAVDAAARRSRRVDGAEKPDADQHIFSFMATSYFFWRSLRVGS